MKNVWMFHAGKTELHVPHCLYQHKI